MADIFISYSQKNRAWVKRLVDALTAEGWTVWWDLNIHSGETFDEAIEHELKQVRCVVAVWSTNAVKSKWVRAEAAWAADHGKVVSIRIEDELELPLKFYHVHTESLVAWDGSRKADAFRKLVEDIRAVVGEPESVMADSGRASELASKPKQQGIAPPARGLEPLSSFRNPLRDGGESPEMVVIPTGEFWMGSDKDRDPDTGFRETPRHRVTIGKPFAMGKYAVTFDDYERFVRATGQSLPNDKGWGRGNRPAIVSWEQAVAYTEFLSSQNGKRYRLPTEAEWEYAARAGTDTAYWWGDKVGKKNANCDGCGSKWANKQTAPVGSFDANPWCLHDTAGNVWEWVQDCWQDNYEGAPTDGSAWLEDAGCKYDQRVFRGGSWDCGTMYVRSAARGFSLMDFRYFTTGLRLAQDL